MLSERDLIQKKKKRERQSKIILNPVYVCVCVLSKAKCKNIIINIEMNFLKQN